MLDAIEHFDDDNGGTPPVPNTVYNTAFNTALLEEATNENTSAPATDRQRNNTEQAHFPIPAAEEAALLASHALHEPSGHVTPESPSSAPSVNFLDDIDEEEDNMLDDELDLVASSESCELESIVSAGSFASDDYDLLDDDIYSDESAPPASTPCFVDCPCGLESLCSLLFLSQR